MGIIEKNSFRYFHHLPARNLNYLSRRLGGLVTAFLALLLHVSFSPSFLSPSILIINIAYKWPLLTKPLNSHTEKETKRFSNNNRILQYYLILFACSATSREGKHYRSNLSSYPSLVFFFYTITAFLTCA